MDGQIATIGHTTPYVSYYIFNFLMPSARNFFELRCFPGQNANLCPCELHSPRFSPRKFFPAAISRSLGDLRTEKNKKADPFLFPSSNKLTVKAG